MGEDIDGNPLEHQESDEDVPMDGAALLKSAMMQYESGSADEDDIDGMLDKLF